MKRTPLSPDERRKQAAARQRRYRERKLVEQHVEASLGLGERPSQPLPEGLTKADLAEVVRDLAMKGVLEGDLNLANKDHVAGINAGLKAQTIIDKREQNAQKNAYAELGRGLLTMLLGGPPPPPALPDGTVIEGEVHEVGEAV